MKYINNQMHHALIWCKDRSFIESVKAAIERIMCVVLGHKLNTDCSYRWCGRCGLAYSEIYHKQDYFFNSGLLDRSLYDSEGKDYKACVILEDEGREYPINNNAFLHALESGNITLRSKKEKFKFRIISTYSDCNVLNETINMKGKPFLDDDDDDDEPLKN